MPVWEYKVITSGKGGFATPALLESFLNQLGREEWEVIHFQAQPDNALAFTGLARRSTQRDWTLEDAVATAARAEADKLRAEFEAKFKGAGASAPAADEKSEAPTAEAPPGEGGLRKLRDTESDLDPDAEDEEGEGDEWDKLGKEDELPTFFEAIQPLMRRNQKGPGTSVGVDHLARKWGMSEQDVVGALKECGFTLPEDEDTPPAYVEYDGDLFWVNMNRRGEMWINSREKQRPAFRAIQGAKVVAEDAPAGEERRSDRHKGREAGAAEGEAAAEPAPGAEGHPSLPTGPALLERIRPLMRRNRGAPGISGSSGFLSRALRCREAALVEAFGSLGLAVPASAGDEPATVDIGDEVWWLNRDSRGGLWINGKRRKTGTEAGPGGSETSEAPSPQETPSASTPSPESGSVLAATRLLLKPAKTGAVAAELCQLADTLCKTPESLLSALTAAGLKAPEKPREKPVFVEQGGEIFWLNRNSKDELWLNAKASKFASGGEEGGGGEGRRRSRRRGAEPSEGAPSDTAADASDTPLPAPPAEPMPPASIVPPENPTV